MKTGVAITLVDVELKGIKSMRYKYMVNVKTEKILTVAEALAEFKRNVDTSLSLETKIDIFALSYRPLSDDELITVMTSERN